jgi:hypothetical protein
VGLWWLAACAPEEAPPRPELPAPPDCQEVELPYDRLDNDCDGTIDCDDPDLVELVDGEWAGDITVEDLPGLCEGYCSRSITGDLTLVESSLTSLQALGCVTAIGGDLTIGDVGGYHFYYEYGNNSLLTLDGLQNLASVGGTVKIESNDVLASLASLGRLREAGGLILFHNEELRSLEGLEGLTSIAGMVAVGENFRLTSLDGLAHLEHIGGSLILFGNEDLVSLDGLEQLDEIASGLEIRGHDQLADVTALHGLTRVGEDVEVSFNPALGDDAAYVLVDEIDTIGGTVTIRNNE